MLVPFEEMKSVFKRILLALSFTEEKAEVCAGLFAGNSRDGVYSHGLNRFPVFVQGVKEGIVDAQAEPSPDFYQWINCTLGWKLWCWYV
jgi:3-dehydro-L-gulonate 2-dehydrogenase